MPDGPYTIREAVQVRYKGRWRDGEVTGLMGSVVTVQVGEGEKALLLEYDEDSENLRKWPGHKRSSEPSTRYKGRQRVRYRRVIE